MLVNGAWSGDKPGFWQNYVGSDQIPLHMRGVKAYIVDLYFRLNMGSSCLGLFTALSIDLNFLYNIQEDCLDDTSSKTQSKNFWSQIFVTIILIIVSRIMHICETG